VRRGFVTSCRSLTVREHEHQKTCRTIMALCTLGTRRYSGRGMGKRIIERFAWVSCGDHAYCIQDAHRL
jgi:hypothetical protein